MKKIRMKIAEILRILFGYGIMTCLFAGGLTFFGYLAAIVIGGDVAAMICAVIYKSILPVIIKASNILVLIGLLHMYCKGEVSLVMNEKKKTK